MQHLRSTLRPPYPPSVAVRLLQLYFCDVTQIQGNNAVSDYCYARRHIGDTIMQSYAFAWHYKIK